MTASRTHQSLKVSLLGLVAALSLGCDEQDLESRDGSIADPYEVLEDSTQEMIELVVDEEEAVAFEPVDALAADIEPSAAGCTLYRPVGWTKNGNSCVEFYLAPGGQPITMPMYDGQSYVAHSTLGGTGQAVVSCNAGAISVHNTTCYGGVIQ